MIVFGATQEERDRVLRYLEGDMPELDSEYMERVGKRFSNVPAKSDEFTLDPQDMDNSLRVIQFFIGK